MNTIKIFIFFIHKDTITGIGTFLAVILFVFALIAGGTAIFSVKGEEDQRSFAGCAGIIALLVSIVVLFLSITKQNFHLEI